MKVTNHVPSQLSSLLLDHQSQALATSPYLHLHIEDQVVHAENNFTGSITLSCPSGAFAVIACTTFQIVTWVRLLSLLGTSTLIDW